MERGRAERAVEAATQLLHIHVQRFRGGLVFNARRLCVSLNSRLESNKEEPPRRLSRSRANMRPTPVSQVEWASLTTLDNFELFVNPALHRPGTKDARFSVLSLQ